MVWQLYSHMHKHLATFKGVPVPQVNNWVVFKEGLHKVTSVWVYPTEVRVVVVDMELPVPKEMQLKKAVSKRRRV